jgi:hypothetical protein
VKIFHSNSAVEAPWVMHATQPRRAIGRIGFGVVAHSVAAFASPLGLDGSAVGLRGAHLETEKELPEAMLPRQHRAVISGAFQTAQSFARVCGPKYTLRATGQRVSP